MSAKRSSSRSPRKTGKKSVRINDMAQVRLFPISKPTNSPQENPHHKDKPSPETHEQEMSRKRRENDALDNRYRNSAAIKDKASYRRITLRKLASQVPEEERIMVPRRGSDFAVRMTPRSEPIMQRPPGFFARLYNRAKSAVAPKKKAGNKGTQKQRR